VLVRRSGQRGHAVLESALVLLIFLGFMLGTLDFAQVLYFHQSLVERVRVAARYAAVHPTDTTGTKNMAVYNSVAAGVSPLLPGLTTSMVNVQLSDAGTPEARVKVAISGYGYQFFSPMMSGTRQAGTISATMISEAP
jgi:Flp pilus assembly protein TadG